MTAFYSEVLTTKGSDLTRWRDLAHEYQDGDIYFTPEYVMAFEATRGQTGRDFGGEGQLFFYGNPESCVIYPFFKRSLAELPFYELFCAEAEQWFDVVSPYGYGGPLAHITEPEVAERLWRDFLKEFHDYCAQNSIVAEFGRLHPYIRNHLPLQNLPDINVRRTASVVCIDLEQDESLLRKNMTKGNRSSVSKARRMGVEIRCSVTKDELDAFYELYVDTMARNEAGEAYLFSRDFLDDICQLLGNSVRLFSACYEGQTIAASLFLFGGKLAHYYLSGSNANFLHLSPNNLLLYEAILWAQGQGYKMFDLGGGIHPGDSLFHFKASFSKKTADFYTYSRTHNEPVYRALCEARERYDGMSQDELMQSDYFPAYRRPGEKARQT